MITPQNHSQDLTPGVPELMAQMTQMQQELAQLKQRAQTFAPITPTATTNPPTTTPPSTLSSSRRKALKRLGLALLGGAAAATVTGFSVSEAKVIVGPTLGTGATTSRAGALVIPPGAAAPINNPPTSGRYYGLIASGSANAFDLSTLPDGDTGVYATSSNVGVYGYSSSGFGIYGNSYSGYGVWGSSYSSYGVYGTSSNNTAVIGLSSSGNGIVGSSSSGLGVYGYSTSSYAGFFAGDVHLTGTLTGGTKSFKIDHPLDPANKYLYHTSVESPDMKNIYDGLVTLDNQGEATVTMPEWFEALNSDFRYQLTCLGEYAPVFVAQEITSRQFKIGGGKPGQRVSWQVTGIRQDAYAKAHRSPVEADKTGDEKGKYIHPELFGEPEEKSVSPRPSQRPGK